MTEKERAFTLTGHGKVGLLPAWDTRIFFLFGFSALSYLLAHNYLLTLVYQVNGRRAHKRRFHSLILLILQGHLRFFETLRVLALFILPEISMHFMFILKLLLLKELYLLLIILIYETRSYL